jgi:hypothetical protein
MGFVAGQGGQSALGEPAFPPARTAPLCHSQFTLCVNSLPTKEAKLTKRWGLGFVIGSVTAIRKVIR